MQLASDLDNPNFVGATNPDALLYVEFYWNEPVLKWQSREASEKAGKRVIVKGQKQPWIRIMRPGDQNTIIEEAVRNDHKARWPEKWLYWQMAEGLIDEGKDIPGWKLEDWTYLDDKADLKRDLNFARYYTVEQVAGASDAQVMRLGIGGMGLREQARVDLRNKLNADVREQVEKKDKEIEIMKKQNEVLAEQMKTLQSQMAALLQAPSEKRGPGRPPKVVNG